VVTIIRRGTCEFDVQVRDQQNGKLKSPEHATGSNIYVAVTAIGQSPAFADYRKSTFASDNTHDLFLSHDDIGKQAHIYARYSNSHGEEGPEGPVETVVIS
jgi:hypothetical protein